MTKKNLMPSIVLSAICLVAALLLSVINHFTSPRILKNQEAKTLAAFAEVLPGATGKVDLVINESYPDAVTAGYKFDNGFVFQMEVKGYANGLVILCGIDLEGKIVGVKHLESNETYGFESQLNGAYLGDTLDSVELIIASGATPKSETSNGYYTAIKAALQAFAIANGAEVDTRTPEKILQDNCNAALGTTNKTFTKWFATEILTGIDKVYETKDGGKVYVIGENFVGVKDGAVTTADASADNKTKALAADSVINGSVPTSVDIPAGADEDIISIKKTTSGNYVIEAKGDGYGVNGGNKYHPASGEKITVKICISSTGAIIDSITTYEKETPDVGGKLLSDPDFYAAYEGKTSSDYNGVADVTKATLTCKGYKDALKNAFAAFDLLQEGGNQ